MKSSTDTYGKVKTNPLTGLPRWLWFILLIVLGYEGAGCLFGGALLIAGPDGRYMDMPVDIMHGVFPDFLIPGIILFALGILNSFAFNSVVRRSSTAWFMTGLALGGLFIWFVVEIIILRELHWLHLMWGFPVFLGYVVAIPLYALREANPKTVKILLVCGILSSLWYIAINIFVPMMYEGYSMLSLTVSELSAIHAPTRILWVLCVMPYPMLFTAFGWGVWQSANGNKALRTMGYLILIYSVLNFFWPPMHQREVIAAGGGTVTDTLHIIWAVMTLIFMLVLMGFGSRAKGKEFRLYTLVTWLIFMVCGILTFLESPGIEANLPTPWIGLWERINISAFMLWVGVFAAVRLSGVKSLNSIESYKPQSFAAPT